MNLVTANTRNSTRSRTLVVGALIAAAAATAGLTAGPGLHVADFFAPPSASAAVISSEGDVDIHRAAAKLSLPDALEQAKLAVFMVGKLDETGGFTQIGTGFAVQDNPEGALIATNAHVAQAVANTVADGGKVVVRRPGIDGPTDFAVRQTPTLHPAYDRWQKVNDRHPFTIVDGTVVQVNVLNPADVALLVTEGGIGGVLELAASDDLVHLRAGTDIIYLGFPAENIFGQKSNVPATANFGHIQSMSGIVLEPTVPQDALTIQHDLTLTGGSSGGPLMVADPITGRLTVIGIHNASSFAFAEGNRIPVGKAYGQRADYVREMLDGSADRVQALRDTVWATELRKLTMPLVNRMDAVEGEIQQRADVQRVLATSGGIGSDASEEFTEARLEVKEGTTYVFVIGSANWDDIDLALRFNGEDVEHRGDYDRSAPIGWTAPANGSIQITIPVNAAFGKSSVELRVYEVKPDDSSK